MRKSNFRYLFLLALYLVISGCAPKDAGSIFSKTNFRNRSSYTDIPYLQEYSIKYNQSDRQITQKKREISVNRDGQIRILWNDQVLTTNNGSLFYDGEMIPDVSYPQTSAKKILGITTCNQQTVYLDGNQVFSNAWAGKLQFGHHLNNPTVFAGSGDFHFLIADSDQLFYFDREGNKMGSFPFKGALQIIRQEAQNSFLIASSTIIAEYTPGQSLKTLYNGSGITSIAGFSKTHSIFVGTLSGYFNLKDRQLTDRLPCSEITTMNEIAGHLWFGSTNGAFRLNEDGKYSYYAGERWLPGSHCYAIAEGPENSVLILTDKGLGKIVSELLTLEDKAIFFEKQVREKNIRYGFNCSSVYLSNGYGSGQTASQPSDNLWTAMYMASQLFRYKVTGSTEAKENALESFEAMERLYTVTGIQGLFARGFERDYKTENGKKEGWEREELLTGSPASLWLPARDHSNWTWRSTASSDQTVGQVFAMTMVLELADDQAWKARALKCLDDLMGYIVKNDLYIIDVDGKPTMWGKWNPQYVNSFPENVGDRKICSSNIIALLQTAYKFTGKEIYKNKVNELIEKYGYLNNLMRPFAQIGPSDSSELSKVLSEEWNHSDDEMYFLAYWGLYPYALNKELQEKFRTSIKDHWEIERPEQNALWNFTYAMTGAPDFDLNQSVKFLQDYPIDLRNFGMTNSQRKDIELLPPNFRRQSTRERLPLGELPLYRHNGNIFNLDSKGDGKSLISAGDVWLLPYWMGRYLGIISEPVKN